MPWVLPNEWGVGGDNEQLGKDVLFGPAKKATRDLVVSLGKSSYVAVSTSFWYEWSLSYNYGFGIDLETRHAELFDDGETKITTSTWPQVGRAVASLLSLPVHDTSNSGKPSLDKYRNDFVYVSSFRINQKDMLESIYRVTGTSEKDWTFRSEDVKQRYANGMAQMKAGNRLGFGRLLYSRVFYPDGSGDMTVGHELQNDVLGLPEEDLDEYTKLALERSKEPETAGLNAKARESL